MAILHAVNEAREQTAEKDAYQRKHTGFDNVVYHINARAVIGEYLRILFHICL